MHHPPIIHPGARSSGVGWWICASILIVGAAVFYQFDPAQNAFYPRCIFYSVTGLYCPGCGASRGLHEILHGHILEAARFNPLIFAFIPMTAACWVAVRRFRWEQIRKDVDRFLEKPWTIWSAAVLVLLFGILRNLPVYPFALLVPPT